MAPEDETFVGDSEDKTKVKKNRLSLPNLVQAGTRALVSPRQMANIATNVMSDVSKVTPELSPDQNKEYCFTRSKIRSQQNLQLKSIVSQKLPNTIAISWDGKKTDTLEREAFGNGRFRNVTK